MTEAMSAARDRTLHWPDPDRMPEQARAALLGPGGPFEMREEDVLGARLEVFVRRAPSLRDLLVGASARFGERPYLVFPDREYSYASVVGPVASAAAFLRERHGVGKGDRVAIAAANCPGWPLAFWAATSLGAITVAMNGWWTAPELAYGLELTAPTVLLGDTRRLARLEGLDPGIPVVDFERDLAEIEGYAPGVDLPDTPIAEDDPFLILFTSGTTGRPKGALLSHRSNIHFIQAALLNGAAGLALRGELGKVAGSPPCVISASPLFHVSGLNCQLVMGAATGMTIVYPSVGRWDEEEHLRLTELHRATSWSLVPTQLWRVLQRPDLDRYDLSSLAQVGGGSSVWPPALLDTLERKLPGVRPGLGTGYGMTETNGLGTSLRNPLTYQFPDSIGQPYPATEVRICDPADGTPLAEGEVGEIWIRSAATFLGYWNNPGATAEALTPDRWYRTGDFGHARHGLVYLEGRRQDLIIRGGENIYPAEIESRLAEHPDIAEAAVIGVAHPTLGHEVKAVVVLRAGAVLGPDDIRAWTQQALATYKVPTHVEIVDSLPHNATGKVMKHLLEAPGAGSGFVEE
jgi:acyl-CoA synthetase (AMP-forming)/AMP-acid ligase II